MSQPTAYTPSHIFLTDQATQSWFPGSSLDVEFNNLKTTTDQVRANLALIQRDDGKLGNGSVTFLALDPSLQVAGLAPVPWNTATAYTVPQVVTFNNALYTCLIAHTSGTFATDLAAGKWQLLISLVPSTLTSVNDPPYNAKGDGSTDDTAALTAAINSGAKHLYFPSPNYKTTSSLTQPSGQRWQGASRGTKILWAGGNNSDVIIVPSGALYNIIENFTIDVGTATGCTGLHIIDTQHARFSDITFLRTGAGSASGTAMRLQAGSGGTGTSFNNAFNEIRHIRSILYAVSVQLDGISSGPTVVTDNTFFNIDLEQTLTGVRIAQWADNNDFFWCRVEVEQPNTFGVIHNDSGTPGSDVGVYANNFYRLAVDAFGAASNVAAIFFNVTKQNIATVYHSPDAFPGSVLVDNSSRSVSHHITVQNVDATTNAAQVFTKNWALTGPTTLLTVANGLNSNLAYTGPLVRLTGASGSFSIGGFLPVGQTACDGARLSIYNGTGQQMTIVNEDVSSTAANRLKTLTGANVTLRAGPSFATFSYNSTDARWILESTN